MDEAKDGGLPRIATRGLEPRGVRLDRFGSLPDTGFDELFDTGIAALPARSSAPAFAGKYAETEDGTSLSEATVSAEGLANENAVEEVPAEVPTSPLEPSGLILADAFAEPPYVESFAEVPFDAFDEDDAVLDLDWDVVHEELPVHLTNSLGTLEIDVESLAATDHIAPSMFLAPQRIEEDVFVALDHPGDTASSPLAQRNGISATIAARRLARQFLFATDEYCAESIDLLGEIIEANGWSAAQVQIRALVSRDCTIREIHRAWQLRELWCEANPLHARFDENAHLPSVYSSRLTWLQAVLLLEHYSWLEHADDVLVELEKQLGHWHLHPELRRRYPIFKDYVLSYRIVTSDPKYGFGLQVNLDPRDERTFDGFLNDCQPEWWHDECDGWEGSNDLKRSEALRLLFNSQD